MYIATCSITRENNMCKFLSVSLLVPNPPESQCPLCGLKFCADVLEVHAASCGESRVSIEKSLDETLQEISVTLEKESWTIHVVRRQFVKTAIEQLEESSTEDGRDS